jgi:two-component system nitrate/nitrite sensor histidine kinase NarX
MTGDRSTVLALERLRAALDRVQDAVVLTDGEGRIVLWNPAAARLYGSSAAEAVGRPLVALLAPDRAAEERALWQSVVAHGEPLGPLELERVGGDGQRLRIELSAAPISGGALLIARDVTPRPPAERLWQENPNLAALLAVTQTIISATDVAPALAVLLDRIASVAPFTDALIFAMADGELAALAQRGAQDERLAALAAAVAEQDPGAPLVVADGLPAPAHARTPQDASAPALRSWLYYPIRKRGGLAGGMLLAHTEPGRYTHEHTAQLSILMHAIDLAIEHQRLLEHMRAVVTQHERRRIARELHDAVTQTLFTISVVAEVLPRLWERNRETALRSLEELRSLARGALAEMRTLLLEMRPESLERAHLRDLLSQLAEAASVRLPTPVTALLDEHCNPPPPVKIALYRIAQEALNNVVKYAESTETTVCLRCTADGLTLTIRDNGIGFDVGQVSSEHLGLRIMRERAAEIGARLMIRSAPQRGAEVTVVWTAETPAGESCEP